MAMPVRSLTPSRTGRPDARLLSTAFVPVPAEPGATDLPPRGGAR
jgi:hypothetical protein